MPYINFLGGTSFVDLFFILCLSLPYCLVGVLQPCVHLLGKGSCFGFSVFDVFVIFVTFLYFPMWYPGSGVVLDCIDS